MRLVPLCTATLSAAVITACGGDGGPPPPPVRLAITAPHDLDVVHEDRVDVEGTVRPTTATVSVEGHKASVGDGGTFRTSVSLQAGMTGVIDARAKQTGVSYEAMERTYLDRISLRRMVSAHDVAATAAYLLSAAGANISGQSLGVDGNVEAL